MGDIYDDVASPIQDVRWVSGLHATLDHVDVRAAQLYVCGRDDVTTADEAGLLLDMLGIGPGVHNTPPAATPKRNADLAVVTGKTKPRRRTDRCKHDHEFTPANTYRAPSGKRQCRKCIARRRAGRESS